jgi:hypothetical protein
VPRGEWQSHLKVEKLINVNHPCIAGPISFISQAESTESGEFTIARLYLEFESLSKVISHNPLWWTSTVKAKAVVGRVLALRFLHGLGLKSNNIHLDHDHRIQIGYFDYIDVKVDSNQIGVFSGSGWTRQREC